MEMKIHKTIVAGLLAGVSNPALAQAQTRDQDKQPVECSEAQCTDAGELVFRLRTRSYLEPTTSGTDKRSPSEVLQPDRRVTIATELPAPLPPQRAPGRATAVGKFSVSLPSGGVIWATEDPDLGRAELSVSAPAAVAYDGTRIVAPVQFFARSNYPDFLQRLEVAVYRSSDANLTTPLVVIPMKIGPVSHADWDGVLPAQLRLRTGDALVYVLRAWGRDRSLFDETYPKRLLLASPEELARSRNRQAAIAPLLAGVDASAQSAASIGAVFAENGLRIQNLPINGSRVRIHGQNLPVATRLTIDAIPYPVDPEGKFAAEFLLPVGHRRFDLGLLQANAKEEQHHSLDVDVTGTYWFGVGIADLTISTNAIDGSRELFAGDTRYTDDILGEGRLAYYVKGKLGGRYLITAQADTDERTLGHLFSGFTSADPQDIFRRLDPDLYYPVYGDDSTVARDVDTMGRFYLRMDWDKNQLLWGNYATGLTGTDYAQYVRSLYGGALSWRSRQANRWGEPNTQVRVFGAQAETAPGHNEFIGTGGSLYYLKHTDVLPGSAQVTIEVRDRTTGRVEQRIALTAGVDYEIDELQGRILLTRALAQVTRDNALSLTRDGPLDGFEQRLIVDYEFVPSGFSEDLLTTGMRGKHWFGDHVGVGATYVAENRDGADYSLYGLDLTLRAASGSYVKAEYARTEALSSPTFLSTNGGLSFTEQSANPLQEGDAKAVEALLKFAQLFSGAPDMDASAWWRETSAGYSTGRYNSGRPTAEYGLQLVGKPVADLSFTSRYSVAESGTNKLVQLQGSADWRIDTANSLAVEVRRVDDSAAATGLLGAVKYTRHLGEVGQVYGQGQLTLDGARGAYARNDMLLMGGRYRFGEKLTLSTEASTGDRGDGLNAHADYEIAPGHSLYSGYTYSTDTTDYSSLLRANRQNGWTFGQRWQASNRVTLYNESQSLKESGDAALLHVFGIDYYSAHGWNLGGSVQRGQIENAQKGIVERRALSLSGGVRTPRTSWQSKLEWRQDTGAEQREQWVTTNRVTHALDDSWRIALRLNYADTQDRIDPAANASFLEGNAGFAWRPWNSSRVGIFGRYSYLRDLATKAQVGGADYDQRSRIASLEGVIRLDQRWELGAKAGRRTGEVRMSRGEGPWLDSAATLLAAQTRYQIAGKWHALAEYRLLDVRSGGTKQGVLIGVDREIAENLRLGLGYNFTEFSDDLTKFDFDKRGLFLNIVGKY